MRLLLISPPVMDKTPNGEYIAISMDAKKVAPPYGIYLLATILQEHGHEVDIADLIASGSMDIGAYLAQLHRYDLVGVGATSFSWPTARQCINEIRRVDKDIPIVLGGIHPTMFDHHVLQTTEATYVIRGEGEYALVELCEALEGKREIDDVTSLTYKKLTGETIRNQPRRVVNLSSLPIPDYSMLPPLEYSGISIESSRGCPFDCSFCSASYRKTYRMMEPSKFVDHVEAMFPYLDVTLDRSIHIVDDEFSANLRRTHAILDEIARRRLNPKLVFNSRVAEMSNPEFVKAVAPYAGRFLVGAECGYNEGLKRTGKKTTVELIEKAAQTLARFGIANLSDFSFVIGFPWEQHDDAVKTISFASRLQIMYGVNLLIQWYMQVPGSRLWHDQKNEGIVSEVQYDEFGLFRNLYLFRTGVKFSLEEFRSISEIILSVRMVQRLGGIGNSSQLQYAHPLPIRRYFPRTLETHADVSGLPSLRELSTLAGGRHEQRKEQTSAQTRQKDPRYGQGGRDASVRQGSQNKVS